MTTSSDIFQLAVEVYEKLSFAAASATLMGESISTNATDAELSNQLLGLGRFLKELADKTSSVVVEYPLNSSSHSAGDQA